MIFTSAPSMNILHIAPSFHAETILVSWVYTAVAGVVSTIGEVLNQTPNSYLNLFHHVLFFEFHLTHFSVFFLSFTFRYSWASISLTYSLNLSSLSLIMTPILSSKTITLPYIVANYSDITTTWVQQLLSTIFFIL